MTRTLTQIGDHLGLIIDDAILDALKIDRDTPLELKVSSDGQGIEVRAIRDDEHRRKVLDSADRVMKVHEDVFRKLAQ